MRSVAGFIDCMGVLTKAGLPFLPIVFKDFENRDNPNYESTYPNLPFPNKPSAKDPFYQRELQRVYRSSSGSAIIYTDYGKRKLSRLNVPIKAVAVWDTVGKPFLLWFPNMII